MAFYESSKNKLLSNIYIVAFFVAVHSTSSRPFNDINNNTQSQQHIKYQINEAGIHTHK